MFVFVHLRLLGLGLPILHTMPYLTVQSRDNSFFYQIFIKMITCNFWCNHVKDNLTLIMYCDFLVVNWTTYHKPGK